MELRQIFKMKAGGALFLEMGGVERYLRAAGWLSEGEQLRKLEKPGEGNMNFVLRAQTDQRSIILKQARPWVEKYPQIEAPLDRIRVEAEFYGLIQQDAFLASFTPHRLAWDVENFILILDDLGEGADFFHIYQKGHAIAHAELEALVQFISHLHQKEFTAAQRSSFPANTALKKLNHEHIFSFPYLEENGFDLNSVQEGLQEVAQPYKRDTLLKEKILALGQRYLGVGPCLIHGDYYPGSWLKVAGGVKVIDPEFGYFGLPEFDLGVMIAHLLMSETPAAEINWVLSAYRTPTGFDESLRQAFTGVEILRRIIGLAQLPLALSLEEKSALLETGRKMLAGWRP